MTEYGREILAQAVGGDGNITLQMEDAVTVAEQRIHRLAVRLIRSDEVEAALVEAGIEIPEVVSDAEKGAGEDDALKMPETPNWEEVESGTAVEFKDGQGEIVSGQFSTVNEDGYLVVTVVSGDESFDTAVLPENVRLAG